MAPSKRSKRSKRSHSKRSHKRAHRSKRASHSRRAHKRHTRRRGGAYAIQGAPVGYALAGDWSSQRSMGQGGDYLKYHAGQHGGALAGAPVSMIAGSVLPAHLQGSAHVAGSFAALQEVAHLRDQAGGKRSKRSKRSRGGKRSKRSRGGKRSKRSKRSRGGALMGAPFNGPSMLLRGGEEAAAGLNPHWRSVEVSAAQARQGL
jgi:hypothetical protein